MDFRFAVREDTALILRFIKALAAYEKMSGDELKESRYERFRRIAFYNEPSAAK